MDKSGIFSLPTIGYFLSWGGYLLLKSGISQRSSFCHQTGDGTWHRDAIPLIHSPRESCGERWRCIVRKWAASSKGHVSSICKAVIQDFKNWQRVRNSQSVVLQRVWTFSRDPDSKCMFQKCSNRNEIGEDFSIHLPLKAFCQRNCTCIYAKIARWKWRLIIATQYSCNNLSASRKALYHELSSLCMSRQRVWEEFWKQNCYILVHCFICLISHLLAF